jgi:hypothetical protein
VDGPSIDFTFGQRFVGDALDEGDLGGQGRWVSLAVYVDGLTPVVTIASSAALAGLD